ncbi:MAG: hypothetical protein QOJ94_1290 [Sphingomonadales bacterium]|jgi:hypothetical protein|nr:hypothetical protein [Sphingomonadales bacterium]
MSLISTLKKIAKAAPAILAALPTVISAVKDVRGALKKDAKPGATSAAADSGPAAGAAANPTG